MGYSVSLQAGLILKLEPKQPVIITRVCPIHDEQSGNFCPECGRPIVELSSLIEIFEDIFIGDYTYFSVEDNNIRCKIEYDKFESIDPIYDGIDQLIKLPTHQEIIDHCCQSKEYQQILTHFNILEETPFIGIYHSY